MLEQSNGEAKVCCKYKTCTNELDEKSAAGYCNTCRIFLIRQSSTIRMDPTSPRQERDIDTRGFMLTLLSGAEILQYTEKLESEYLAMRSEILRLRLDEKSPRVRKSLTEDIAEAHALEDGVSIRAKQAKTREKKTTGRIENLRKLFPHMNDSQIKKMMGEGEEIDL